MAELYGTTREKGPVKDRVVVTYDMGFPKVRNSILYHL